MILKPPISKRHTLSGNERLKSRKLIGQLFSEGKPFFLPPFRVLYLFSNAESRLQAGFSVGTRNFKKATDRNRIKRLMREAYRQQKHELYSLLETKDKHLALFIIYTPKEMPDYNLISKKMNEMISGMIKKLSAAEPEDK